MDALLYVRWSTKDQSKGDSERRQIDLAGFQCRQHNWTLTETLIENGKSAYHGRNRAVGGKLHEIEERAARGELAGKVLIVEAMDRLSRQEPLESVTLLNTLAKQGLTICESSTGTIYDSERIRDHWAHLLIAFARAGEAHDSSRLKAKRVSGAWRRTQETGKTKDGTDDPRLCPAWMEVIDGKFTPIEERAEIIRGMFERSAEGWGLRKIAGWANEQREAKGWPKGVWHIRTVTNMLHSRRVIGEYQAQTRTEDGRMNVAEPIKLYPPIIPLELWHRTEASLLSRQGTGGPRQKCANVLSNLCRCQYREPGSNIPCGSRMTLTRQKRGPAQIACSDFARAGACTCNANYRYDDILNGILDNLLELALPSSTSSTNTADIALLKAELDRKRARLDELADELIEEKDEVKERAYQRFKRRVEEDAQALRVMLGENEKQANKAPASDLAHKVLELRDQLADSVEARMAVQNHLGHLIDVILMDPEDRSATVVVLGGLKVMKLDRRGNVVRNESTAHMLQDQTITDKLGREITFDANVDNLKNVLAGGNPTRLNKVDQVAKRG